MKKLFVLTIAFMAIGVISNAQCDSAIKWTCNKMKILDADGNVKNEKDESVIVQVSKNNITVTPADETRKMEGAVDDINCKWTEPGKVGKTVIKSKLTDIEKTRNATITIEGINGKITITFEAPEETNKIVLDVKEFAAVK